jgi:hypothetical protein
VTRELNALLYDAHARELYLAAATRDLGPSTVLDRPAFHPDNHPTMPGPIRAALEARIDKGLRKYGVALAFGWDLALLGAWQEALDLYLYLLADPGASQQEIMVASSMLILLSERVAREINIQVERERAAAPK